MYPILFRIPLPDWDFPFVGHVDSIPIYSYGVMLGISLVVGWYLTLGLAERDGLPRHVMANNYVITALAAVVVSRLLYFVTNPDEYEGLATLVSFQRGGLVAYGGFIGGYLASWGYLRLRGIRLMPWADVAVPSLAAGLGITRVGCYLFGCDFGRPLADGAPTFLKDLGTFPHWDPAAMPGGTPGSPAFQAFPDPLLDQSLPVHPTQLYESLVGFGLLALLLVARRWQTFRGQIFFLFAFSYGLCRFVLEIYRGDGERGSVPIGGAHYALIAGCLAVFAASYAIGFASMVKNVAVRRATQVAAFVPAIAVYLGLGPADFDSVESNPWLKHVSLSTSQFIGLATAVAVGVAFMLFHRAAIAHPESAMDLGVPEHLLVDDDEEEADEDDSGDADAERDRASDPNADAAYDDADGGTGDDEPSDEAPATETVAKKPDKAKRKRKKRRRKR